MADIDAQLQAFADAKQEEINAELEAFFAATLVTVGALVRADIKSASQIKSAIDIEVAKFMQNTQSTLLSTAETASFSLQKVRAINQDAMLTPEMGNIINNFVNGLNAEFSDFLNSKSTEISNSVYQQIITGNNSVDEIVANVRKSFEKAGMGAQNYRGLKNLVTTKVFEIESMISLELSNTQGINRFKYVGGVIDSTRTWCLHHDGEILTKEQIADWANQSWEGKKDGDPFVVRGGWNCRHHWEPVLDKKD